MKSQLIPTNMRKAGGLAVVAVAIVMLAILPAARGGAPHSATYVGSDVCRGCHNGLHSAAAVAAWENSDHPKAMWAVGKPPAGGRILGDFSASAPFPKDQVAYVLGVGTRTQAYLDRNYMVLPGEWDVKAKAWQPRQSADGKTQCVGCHVTGFNGADNAWKEMGVGCEICHGPGSEHMVSRDKHGTITNPMALDPEKRVMICAQCHAEGKSKDGVHAFPIGFTPGGDLDQLFTYAQSAPQGDRNSQYNDMRFGGGNHLAAGTICTTCHDPHDGQGGAMLRQTQPGLCTQCHKDLTGAPHSPESLKSTDCAVCHMRSSSHAFVPPGHKMSRQARMPWSAYD